MLSKYAMFFGFAALTCSITFYLMATASKKLNLGITNFLEHSALQSPVQPQSSTRTLKMMTCCFATFWIPPSTVRPLFWVSKQCFKIGKNRKTLQSYSISVIYSILLNITNLHVRFCLLIRCFLENRYPVLYYCIGFVLPQQTIVPVVLNKTVSRLFLSWCIPISVWQGTCLACLERCPWWVSGLLKD